MDKSYVLVDFSCHSDGVDYLNYLDIIFSWNDLTDAICQLEDIDVFFKYLYKSYKHFNPHICKEERNKENEIYIERAKLKENTDRYYILEYNSKLGTFKKVLSLKYRKKWNNGKYEGDLKLEVDTVVEKNSDIIVFTKLHKLSEDMYQSYEFELSWEKSVGYRLSSYDEIIFTSNRVLDIFKYVNEVFIKNIDEGYASKDDIKKTIKQFEQQFNMSSEEFINLRKIGKAPDTFEAMLWKTLLRTI